MTEPTTLCKYEIEILRECAGEIKPRPWGAAVGAALGVLRGSGYIDAAGVATLKGRGLLTPTPETTE